MTMHPTTNQSVIQYNEEKDILLMKMHGHMTLDEYKTFFENILTEAKKHNCSYWIYDLSSFEYNSLQARTWQITVFLPRCFRELAQEIVVGMIPPQDAVHRIGVQVAIKATENMNYPYCLKYFKNIERAQDWILSKNNSDN